MILHFQLNTADNAETILRSPREDFNRQISEAKITEEIAAESFSARCNVKGIKAVFYPSESKNLIFKEVWVCPED